MRPPPPEPFTIRTRTLSRVAVSLLAAGMMLVPLGAAGATTGPEYTSTIGSDYREDPYLSSDQKRILDRLAERSTTRLAAESWAHGRSVGRLELTVPSGLPERATLAEHALAFVTGNAALWNLPDNVRLDVVTTVEDGECSGVTLALTAGEFPVYNAVVTVVLTPDGTLRGVAGRLDGRPLGVVASSRTSAEDAGAAVRTYIEERTGEPTEDVALPRPTQVVVDPFFLTDDDHAAAVGWLFAERPGGTGPGGGVVVNGLTGTVAAAGTGVTMDSLTVSGCEGSNPAKVFFPYVIDPMTRTPAMVDFGRYGTRTVGATPTERAYHLLSQPFMTSLYGDGDPRRHLRDPEEVPTVGGRVTVRFAEYYGGLPVEGARVSVMLLPNGNARLVTARFVHFPQTSTAVTVAEADALAAAADRYRELACQGEPGCDAELVAETLAHPPAASLVVLSSEIVEGTAIPSLPPGQERLAYKIEYVRRVLYWDATDNVELYDYPTAREAIPHIIRNDEEDDRTEIVSGVPVPGVSPHPDSTRVAAWLNALDAFYLGLGRNGYDDNGGLIDIRVRESMDNARWCFVLEEPPCDVRIRLGVEYTSADILAHEFTHGVVETTTDYNLGGEAGALDEHYADVMGNIAFPDSNPNEWLVGEESIEGAFRDMAHPGAYGDPEHYATMRLQCFHRSCRHSWAGVPNRAAVLIADGGVPGSPHPGLGRLTVATLYLTTLESGLGGSADLFIDQRINTIAICETFVEDATVIDGRVLTPDDCDHVRRAYAAVGVEASVDLGWTLFAGYQSDVDVVIREGVSLLPPCTIANQILWAHTPETGEIKSSDIADGLSVDFAGEWGARVTARGATVDPANRMVAYSMWSTWVGFGVVDIHEIYSKPSGISDEDCRRPAGTHRRTLYSTARVSHWATFLDGHKGDDTINTERYLPPSCTLNAVTGLHYHDWELPLGPPTADLYHGQHGFRLSRTASAANGLAVNVHWWHSGTSSIKVRVQYDLFEADGTDCIVDGLQDDP